MAQTTFSYKLADAQAVRVSPMQPRDFPSDEYRAYVQALRGKAQTFWLIFDSAISEPLPFQYSTNQKKV